MYFPSTSRGAWSLRRFLQMSCFVWVWLQHWVFCIRGVSTSLTLGSARSFIGGARGGSGLVSGLTSSIMGEDFGWKGRPVSAHEGGSHAALLFVEGGRGLWFDDLHVEWAGDMHKRERKEEGEKGLVFPALGSFVAELQVVKHPRIRKRGLQYLRSKSHPDPLHVRGGYYSTPHLLRLAQHHPALIYAFWGWSLAFMSVTPPAYLRHPQRLQHQCFRLPGSLLDDFSVCSEYYWRG
ncbi:hypothetical protein BDN72DRAFT_429299 [Pluteus cervinus]|uniref:Uncharacterized protein n=1 Tax=Pluteus cervinus TaxID=181527 RepID=A0ACD3A869_9AGAR|nr:hypothetical protein BDN72DRAFT_429299 [Pluteus cervinus]